MAVAAAKGRMDCMAVGLWVAVAVSGRIAVTPAAIQGAAAPGRGGVGRDGSSRDRRAVAVAVCIGTGAVTAARDRAPVINSVAEVWVEFNVNHPIDMLAKHLWI